MPGYLVGLRNSQPEDADDGGDGAWGGDGRWVQVLSPRLGFWSHPGLVWLPDWAEKKRRRSGCWESCLVCGPEKEMLG